jgi:hypothetical protein
MNVNENATRRPPKVYSTADKEKPQKKEFNEHINTNVEAIKSVESNY